MTFVFPLLLGGVALIGIPVLIHLIMRKKPRTLPFPAFRFLLQRQRINVRRLRLRHLLLLALRMLLLAGIALAVARPQVLYEGFYLRGDRPVAVVMVFDTSFTMQYKTTTEVSRLEQAKKHGLELIDQLPPGSWAAILDSADPAGSSQTQWHRNMQEARERIAGLQWKPANAPVSQRLEDAYRMLADLARNKEEAQARRLPRAIFIFSDRTRASWDAARTGQLQDAADRVPPAMSGLQQVRADMPNLVDLLTDLLQRIPADPTHAQTRSFVQDLLQSLGQLKEALPRIGAEDLAAHAELNQSVDNVRKRARELSAHLAGKIARLDEDEDRQKLQAALKILLLELAGARAFYIDVGIDQPIDLTLLDAALPRSGGQMIQAFTDNDQFPLRAHVLATGKNASTEVRVLLGGKTMRSSVDLKAGEVQIVPFEVNCRELGLGQHSAEVHLATHDLLPGNNSRYVTFAVRLPRRVLVLADNPAAAGELAIALASNGFVPEVFRPETQPKSLLRYQAVYLLGLKAPDRSLWTVLEEFVNKGGGVGVIPGGDDMERAAYNSGPAQSILPGTWQYVVAQKEKPARWNLDQATFQHALMRPFRDWSNESRNIDFIRFPRTASRYWDVKPHSKDMVLVNYVDDQGRPALLERQANVKQDRPGKVLMFTTRLDSLRPGPVKKGGKPAMDERWNDYLEKITSFYPVLIGLCTNYLANDAEMGQLNFVCGKDPPVVPLPPSPRFPVYELRGPNIDDKDREVKLPEGANNLVLKQAVYPGNYTVSSMAPNEGKFTARFSINLPAEESNLTRIPVPELEAVLGEGSVLAGQDQASLHDIMQGRWSEPVELFPTLMVLILLALAVENLLANKFYRGESS